MFKVISFDLFATLVSLDAIIPNVWKRVLERELSTQEVAAHAAGLSKCYMPVYHTIHKPPFVSMRELFRGGFEKYFREAGIEEDPERAADIFIEEHNHCPLYPDAVRLLSALEKSPYRVIISTDADEGMVSGLLEKIPHESAFVSETLGVYKANEENAFFNAVLEKTGVKPDEILHIGDGRPDIIGGKRAGLTVCHINRGKGVPETNSFKADVFIKSLDELHGILF